MGGGGGAFFFGFAFFQTRGEKSESFYFFNPKTRFWVCSPGDGLAARRRGGTVNAADAAESGRREPPPRTARDRPARTCGRRGRADAAVIRTPRTRQRRRGSRGRVDVADVRTPRTRQRRRGSRGRANVAEAADPAATTPIHATRRCESCGAANATAEPPTPPTPDAGATKSPPSEPPSYRTTETLTRHRPPAKATRLALRVT